MDRDVSYKNVKEMIDIAINKINTMFLAIVEEYNIETGKITVLPKMKLRDSSGEFVDRAVLFECPTCCVKASDFYLRIPYKKGDLVYVGCSQEALDDLIIDNNTTITNLFGVSRFRLTDAVVLGGIFCETENTMTTENSDDFIIQNRNNGDIIVLKKSGGVSVKTSTKFEINAADVIINADNMQMNVSSTVTTGDTIVQNVSTTTNSGTVSVSGGLTANTISSTGKGISLDNHTHTYLKPKDIDKPESTSVANK